MIVEIDKSSGFCFGVVNAIKIAEDSLKNENELYCLGDIVHNGEEINRLEKLGLKTISRKQYFTLKNCSVLIRAHGEPPETYQYAIKNNIALIDATCPVVLKLQKKVLKSYNENKPKKGQIVILGKKGHAEVVGLNGQTNNEAIILQTEEDLNKINYSQPVTMFSQTTQSVDEFKRLAHKIKESSDDNALVKINDTICRQVANRVPKLEKFVSRHDLVLFVSGKKSSNGKFLFEVCKQKNSNTYFVSRTKDLNKDWFKEAKSVGICGATSTPQWLMEDIAEWIKNKF
ncbi:MAG: 4-hydroxy-3-methylbut-2-enyl diphosphate reductase [Mariniphaga sp.]|nr:4-hydroxy-3-methylbut-2-enyl diphosphate reductase [Mariniphaga sp.]